MKEGKRIHSHQHDHSSHLSRGPLAVPGLGLCASTAGHLGSVPGGRIHTPQAPRQGQKREAALKYEAQRSTRWRMIRRKQYPSPDVGVQHQHPKEKPTITEEIVYFLTSAPFLKTTIKIHNRYWSAPVHSHWVAESEFKSGSLDSLVKPREEAHMTSNSPISCSPFPRRSLGNNELS